MNFKKIVPVFAAAITLSLTALAGTSGSKSDVHAETKAATTTYYAIKNPPGSTHAFRWTSNFNEVVEGELDCAPLLGASCEVEATSQPADGQMPPGQTPINEAYQ